MISSAVPDSKEHEPPAELWCHHPRILRDLTISRLEQNKEDTGQGDSTATHLWAAHTYPYITCLLLLLHDLFFINCTWMPLLTSFSKESQSKCWQTLNHFSPIFLAAQNPAGHATNVIPEYPTHPLCSLYCCERQLFPLNQRKLCQPSSSTKAGSP